MLIGWYVGTYYRSLLCVTLATDNHQRAGLIKGPLARLYFNQRQLIDVRTAVMIKVE